MAKSWIKRRHSLSTSAGVCLSTTFGSTFSVLSLGWSRAVVQEGHWSIARSLCLKWLTMSFPTSGVPANLFLNFADDALQVTSPKHYSASRTFSWRLRLCSLEENATLLQLCGTRWRKLRSRSSHVTKFLLDLLASVAPKKKNESKQTDQIFKSSSTNFANLVAKAYWSDQTQGRLEGDR